MEKRFFEIFSPEKILSETVEWQLCFLCQKDEQKDLQIPYNKNGK